MKTKGKHKWFEIPSSPHQMWECWKCGCIKGYSPVYKKIIYVKDHKTYEKLPPCL